MTNTLITATYWEINRQIVEFEQKGKSPGLVSFALAPFHATLEELESLAAKDTVVAKVARRINLKRLHRDLRAEPVGLN